MTRRTAFPKHQEEHAIATWKDPLYQKVVERQPPGSKPGDYLTSLEIVAHKLG